MLQQTKDCIYVPGLFELIMCVVDGGRTVERVLSYMSRGCERLPANEIGNKTCLSAAGVTGACRDLSLHRRRCLVMI